MLLMFRMLQFVGISICLGFALLLSSSCLASEEVKEDKRTLAERPAQEQHAHRSLMAKTDLLDLHTKHLMKTHRELVELMREVEHRKDASGNISEEEFSRVLETVSAPRLQDLAGLLKGMVDDRFVGYKARFCLELVSANDGDALYSYFEQVEKEILNDIQCYAAEGIDLPQYCMMHEFHAREREGIPVTLQLFQMMNPTLFQK